MTATATVGGRGEAEARPPDYIVGLDRGQAQDYTALVVVERSWEADEAHYAARHLRRWPLGTSYTAITRDVAGLVRTAPLCWPKLAVDETGAGRAVVDMIRGAGVAAQLVPITVTAGHAITPQDDGSYHVAKKQLVSVLQVLLQTRRLKVAPVPERDVLVKELLAFRVKITEPANETFESWRERDHDDLVLAVALAVWLAEAQGVWAAPTCLPDSAPRLSMAERVAAGHGPAYQRIAARLGRAW
jgi:hypothetical protein